MSASKISTDALLQIMQQKLVESKAVDIEILNLCHKSSITDFYIIASFASSRQVKTVSKNIIKELKTLGFKGVKFSGLEEGNWVAIDCGSIILHIFRPEVRNYYNLEALWQAETQQVFC